LEAGYQFLKIDLMTFRKVKHRGNILPDMVIKKNVSTSNNLGRVSFHKKIFRKKLASKIGLGEHLRGCGARTLYVGTEGGDSAGSETRRSALGLPMCEKFLLMRSSGFYKNFLFPCPVALEI